MASYSRKHTELMAGKGLHKSPLAVQSCYYYLVPKLPPARSPSGAEPSTKPSSCLSVWDQIFQAKPDRGGQHLRNHLAPLLIVRIKIHSQRGEQGLPRLNTETGQVGMKVKAIPSCLVRPLKDSGLLHASQLFSLHQTPHSSSIQATNF